MLAIKDLVHVSLKEVEPYWEDFVELQNLYLDGSPVIIGHRGNLYSVDLRSTWDEYHTMGHPYGRFGNLEYSIKRVRVSIFDIGNNRTVGDGTFDMAFDTAFGGSHHIMSEVRKVIQDAIIKINMKPTDFYK